MRVVKKTSTMRILTDNDVVGAVRAFRRILESPEWVELTETLELEFIALKDVELSADASDVTVWQRSQEVGALLITGNRSSGAGSLDHTIAEQSGPESLPRVVKKWQCLAATAFGDEHAQFRGAET
jgi:hypothetical protein